MDTYEIIKTIDKDIIFSGFINETEFRRRIDAVIELRVKGGGIDWTWKRAENIMLGSDECYICKAIGTHEPFCSRGKPTRPTPLGSKEK